MTLKEVGQRLSRGARLLLFGRSTKKMVDDFQRDFPDQCPICSFHAFGIREGYVTGPVEEHDCPEKMARWQCEDEVW